MEVAYRNEKTHIVHIGGKMIPPNETRMVDKHCLEAHQSLCQKTNGEGQKAEGAGQKK